VRLMKKFQLVIIILLFSFFAKAQEIQPYHIEMFDDLIKSEIQQTKTKTYTSAKEMLINSIAQVSNPQIDMLLQSAQEYLGIGYKRGGIDVTGFDCSGFVRECFTKIGIELPRSSREQGQEGIIINKIEAQPGDLIFFSSPNSGKKIGHVGIVTNVNNGIIEFVHSAWSKGVSYDCLQNSQYFSKRFIEIRRVVQ
jgi:cell wall-associated NlpC family hydrolase